MIQPALDYPGTRFAHSSPIPWSAALCEIVDYLNEALVPWSDTAREPMFSAHDARLTIHANRVEAQVGPFVLRTVTRQIVSLAGTHGYLASLAVQLATRKAVAPDTLLRLQPSAPAVVAMDRLCRVLHMRSLVPTDASGSRVDLHYEVDLNTES